MKCGASCCRSVAQSCLFVTPWKAMRQASLSFTISWTLLKLMSIESVMPFNHLILCPPLLLLPSVFPSIRVFSNELALHFRSPKYWSMILFLNFLTTELWNTYSFVSGLLNVMSVKCIHTVEHSSSWFISLMYKIIFFQCRNIQQCIYPS